MIEEVLKVLLNNPLETIAIFTVLVIIIKLTSSDFRNMIWHDFGYNDMYFDLKMWFKYDVCSKIIKRYNRLSKKSKIKVFILIETIILTPMSLNLFIFNPPLKNSVVVIMLKEDLRYLQVFELQLI